MLAAIATLATVLGCSAAPQPQAPSKSKVTKSIDDGLAWLARHQSADGSWGIASLQMLCPEDTPCFNPKDELVAHFDEGLTALALLCFLREGMGPESKERWRDPRSKMDLVAGPIVRRGLDWLKRAQQADGAVARSRPFMYNHAIAALALAEACRASKDPAWRECAQRAVEYLQKAQKPNPAGEGAWGWRYASRTDIESRRAELGEEDYAKEMREADTSVTGWAMLALHAAKDAKLEVSAASLMGAVQFFESATLQDGRVGYQDSSQAGLPLGGAFDDYDYHFGTMSALGVHILLAAGQSREHNFFDLAAGVLMRDLPRVTASRKSLDYYYWFHGLLALNDLQMNAKGKLARDKAYDPWYAAALDSLSLTQNSFENRCSIGGWIEQDRWSHTGGPVYSTAMAVLALQLCRVRM